MARVGYTDWYHLHGAPLHFRIILIVKADKNLLNSSRAILANWNHLRGAPLHFRIILIVEQEILKKKFRIKKKLEKS